MDHQLAKSIVVFVRQVIHQVRECLILQRLIFDDNARDELVVQVKGEERDGQGAEVILEHRCDAADVVEPIGVKKIERIVVASFEELGDCLGLSRTSRLAVDPFVIKSKGLDGVNALLNDDRKQALPISGIRVDLLDEVSPEHGWC